MPSPLAANLKHLYQRRALWFSYAVLGIAVAFPMVMLLLIAKPEAGAGRFSYFLLLSLIAGILAASLQKEILTLPYSHVLPGHRSIPRPFIFIVGLALNVPLSLLLLRYPGLTAHQSFLAILSAASFGMAVYLLVALGIFTGPRLAQFVGFLPILLFVAAFAGIPEAFEYTIVHSPFGVMLMCALVWTIAWPRLADTRTFRVLCGNRQVSLLDAWNLRKAREVQRLVVARKLAERDPDHDLPPSYRLIDLMRRRIRPGTPMRVCGALYESLGPASRRWVTSFSLFILLFLVAFSYLSVPSPAAYVFFLMPYVFAVQMRFPADFRLFLPLGRCERFRASIGFVLAVTSLFAGAGILLMLVLHGLSPVMPPVVLKSTTFTFHAIGFQAVCLILLVIPLGFLAQLFLPDNFLKMLPFFAFMIALPLIALKLSPPAPSLIVAVLAAVWTLFFLLLRYHCARRSLLGRA